MATGVFLGPEVLARIQRLSGSSGKFADAFASFRNHEISWHNVPFLYLTALHSKYSNQENRSATARLAGFMREVFEPGAPLLWFGLLAYDRSSLEEMLKAYDGIVGKGTDTVAQLWDHFESKRERARAASEEAMLYRQLQSRHIPSEPPRPLKNEWEMDREVQRLRRAVSEVPVVPKKVTIVDPMDPPVVFSWGD